MDGHVSDLLPLPNQIDQVQSAPKVERKRKGRKKNDTQVKRMNVNTSEKASSTSREMSVDRASLASNRFAILSDNEINIVENNTKSGMKDGVNESISMRSNDSVAKPKDNLKNTVIKRNAYCPPIMLFNVDIKSLIQQLKNKKPQIDFKIINKSARKSKLLFKDAAVYDDMMLLLKQKKIDSYSYTPTHLKRVSALIRGLHHSMSVEEIKNELDYLIPNTIDNINEYVTPNSKKSGNKTGLFMVTLLPGKTMDEVLPINCIGYQKITWEKPKNFDKVVQCKKCQGWGHVAKNFNRMYQCVKCNSPHEPGQCQNIKNDESPPYCVNCKNWGHPANYRGCPIYKQFLAAKERKDAVMELFLHQCLGVEHMLTLFQMEPLITIGNPKLSKIF